MVLDSILLHYRPWPCLLPDTFPVIGPAKERILRAIIVGLTWGSALLRIDIDEIF